MRIGNPNVPGLDADIISFEYAGKLPCRADVTVLIGGRQAGNTLCTYRYDVEKNQFVKLGTVCTDENG